MFITDMLEKDTNWSISLRRISAPEVRLDLVVSSGSANSLLAREFQNEEYFSRKDLPYDKGSEESGKKVAKVAQYHLLLRS